MPTSSIITNRILGCAEELFELVVPELQEPKVRRAVRMAQMDDRRFKEIIGWMGFCYQRYVDFLSCITNIQILAMIVNLTF